MCSALRSVMSVHTHTHTHTHGCWETLFWWERKILVFMQMEKLWSSLFFFFFFSDFLLWSWKEKIMSPHPGKMEESKAHWWEWEKACWNLPSDSVGWAPGRPSPPFPTLLTDSHLCPCIGWRGLGICSDSRQKLSRAFLSCKFVLLLPGASSQMSILPGIEPSAPLWLHFS